MLRKNESHSSLLCRSTQPTSNFPFIGTASPDLVSLVFPLRGPLAADEGLKQETERISAFPTSRFPHCVCTPKHGSWLDMAEIELSVPGRQCLDRRIPDKAILTTEVKAWVEERNAQIVNILWRYTAADARIKLISLYPKIEI